MTMYHPVSRTHFVTGPDHANEQARLDRGTKVAAQTTSSLIQQNPELKDAAGQLNQKTIDLTDLVGNYNKASVAFALARHALADGVTGWDDLYGVFTSVASKFVKSPADAAACGLEMRGTVHYALQAPLKIDLVHRIKKDELFIHVHRPKGMRVISTEISSDPTNPASFKELDGTGATHTIPHPAPGTYAVRAACKNAHAKSDYCIPALITIK